MDTAAYDAWYQTRRGAWIDGAEYRLLHRLLAPSPGDSLLDVGCGTGYFTRRFAPGQLNRRSLLYLEKGRNGGIGAYRGARWHTVHELKDLLSALAVEQVHIRTAVFLPTGTPAARAIEAMTPNVVPWGGFIAAAGRMRTS